MDLEQRNLGFWTKIILSHKKTTPLFRNKSSMMLTIVFKYAYLLQETMK